MEKIKFKYDPEEFNYDNDLKNAYIRICELVTTKGDRGELNILIANADVWLKQAAVMQVITNEKFREVRDYLWGLY